MSGEERVEDTRTLQPGDRVRVDLAPYEGVVESCNDETFTMRSLAHGTDVRSLAHDWIALGGTVGVYRLPKPLPPEPPVGAEVLAADDTRWRRQDDESANRMLRWHTMPEDWGWATWESLLRERGPVRLLGDPIEAP